MHGSINDNIYTSVKVNKANTNKYEYLGTVRDFTIVSDVAVDDQDHLKLWVT